MAVPRTGKFKMFGTGSAFTIEGAISESNSSYDGTDRFSGSAHLIGDSISNKYDTDYSGIIQTNRINVSESIQYRGYPITTATFNLTAKCNFTSSRIISGAIAPPGDDEAYMCLDFISGFRIPGLDTRRYGWTTTNTNITSSGGFGDNSYPVSSSYGFHELSHSDDRLRLRINVNGSGETPPTFTSMTISSPGNTDLVLDYCDLLSSASSGDIWTYTWNSLDPDNHFSSDNCITASFDTTAVGYFTDCYPSSPTNTFTITNGHTYINSQQSCDENTSGTIYFHSDEVSSTNPISVGDIAYNNSDGRSLNLYNGEDKYWGINTSSANTLNSIPDKIVQIGTNGRVNQVLDCTQTPPPVLPTASAVYDCDTTSNSNYIYLFTASYSGDSYLVYNISGDSEVTQSFGYSSLNDRPNKFTAYDSSGSYDDPVYTTGWVGDATYSNSGGQSQWSTPLSTVGSGSIQIKWKSSTDRQIRIDYGRANPNDVASDSAVWCLVCSGSLKNLQIATGSSIIEACRSGSIGDSNHYHYHPTSSFSSARVYNDNDGLDHVTGSSDYFSYTSSDGTRYYYQVGTTGHFGEITNHVICPGTKIAGIYMGASGKDCDDSQPTVTTNLVYVKSDWSGFVEQTNIASSSYGDLVIDNTNFSANDEVVLEIYDNDHAGTIIDPKSRTNISADVSNTDNATTYLVERTSLLDQSSGANKILATVEKDDARTPTTTIKFSPCDGYGDCTEFETSNGFYASSFSGDDPAAAGMCTNTFTSNLYIEMSGLQPQVGEQPSLTCGGSPLTNPNTYFTIRNSIIGTFIIKMDSDGDTISQVWTCTGADAPSTGSNTFWISAGGKSNLSSFCGEGSDENDWDEFTTDAPSWSGGVGYTVYNDLGAAHNGGGKYWRLYQTYANAIEPDSYDAPGVNQAVRYWKINSAGTITSKHTFTCST